MFRDVQLDTDGQLFLEEIAEAMQSAFAISEDEAVGRISTAWKGRRITSEAVIFHESPEYWAKALFYGRTDFWRYTDSELTPVPFGARPEVPSARDKRPFRPTSVPILLAAAGASSGARDRFYEELVNAQLAPAWKPVPGPGVKASLDFAWIVPVAVLDAAGVHLWRAYSSLVHTEASALLLIEIGDRRWTIASGGQDSGAFENTLKEALKEALNTEAGRLRIVERGLEVERSWSRRRTRGAMQKHIAAWARQLYRAGDPSWAEVLMGSAEALRPGGSDTWVRALTQAILSDEASPAAQLAVERIEALSQQPMSDANLLRLAEEVASGARDDFTAVVSGLIAASGHHRRGDIRLAQAEFSMALNLLVRHGTGEQCLERVLADFEKLVDDANRKAGSRLAEHAKQLIDAQRFEAAVPILSQAIDINARDTAAWNLRGVAHLNNYMRDRARSDFESAYADFTKAIKAAKTKAEKARALCNRGLLLYKVGRLRPARKDLEAAVQANPKHARAWTNLGLIEEDEGHLEKAIRCHERATRCAPALGAAWSNLADALDHAKRYGEAEAAASRAIELDQEGRSLFPRLIRASARLELGRYDESISDAEEALKLNDRSAEAWNARGAARYRRGLANGDQERMCALAKADFLRACELAPDASEVHANLALAHFTENNRPAAHDEAKKALDLKPPKNPVALSVLSALEGTVHERPAPEPPRVDRQREREHELVGAASTVDN